MARPPRLPLALLALLAATAVAQDTADLGACRRVADATQRLACYDRLADGAPSIRPVAPTAPAAAAAPAAASAATSGETLFGKPPEVAADTATRAAGATPVDSITAAVTVATRGDDRRLTLTLANGQAWRQLDTDWIDVRPGDAVTIRKGLLGSYVLTGARSRATVHVKRLD